MGKDLSPADSHGVLKEGATITFKDVLTLSGFTLSLLDIVLQCCDISSHFLLTSPSYSRKTSKLTSCRRRGWAASRCRNTSCMATVFLKVAKYSLHKHYLNEINQVTHTYACTHTHTRMHTHTHTQKNTHIHYWLCSYDFYFLPQLKIRLTKCFLTSRLPWDVYICRRYGFQLALGRIYVRIIHRIFLLLLLSGGIPLCTSQKVRYLLC